MDLGIVGSGEWGRALATLAAEAGHRPRVGYRGRPIRGFPGTPNLGALARECDLLLLAVSPSGIREVVRKLRPGPEHRVVIAARGLEPGTGTWLSEVVLAESAALRVGALSGPALAAEVVARRPSALVAASAYAEVRTATQEALHSAICRVYTSDDLRGVELSGAVNSVLAVSVGITDALQLGVGVRGVVVTRGLAEARRLGAALGAQDRTFAGLAGLGDLVAAASHPQHPGYRAGGQLVRGEQPPADLREAAEAILTLAASQGVEMPMTQAIAAIASGKLKPRIALDMLMRRDPRGE